MTNYKQVIYQNFSFENPHTVHELKEATLPDTVPDDKLIVRMICAPIHPCDTLCAMGVVNGVKFPCIGGAEGVGVIDQVGASLQGKWKVGQRVHLGANYLFGDWSNWNGVWSEYVVCPDNALIPVPDGIDDDVAAQFVVNPLTALAMVKEFGLGPGKILMQTAAASVLGKLMIQLSRIYDFDTVNIVRRQESADELKNELGIDSVYVYDGSSDSLDKMKAAIAVDFPGRNIDFCIEAVGGETLKVCLELLGPNGDMYIYGSMTGDVTLTLNTVADIVMKNNALKGWSTQETWMRKTSDEEKLECINTLWGLIADGKLTMPETGQRFSLGQISEAMTASCAPGRSGKVLLDCKP
jgi:NADPH:quinone reductase-like Zn-dependent oxidoreductase